MRQDIGNLQSFYASDLGQLVTQTVCTHLQNLWGDEGGAAQASILGFGYATPYLQEMALRGWRTVAAMPAQQGAEVWPSGAPSATVLVDEQHLPFADEQFDRVVLVHAIEDSPDPQKLLRECWRVCAPEGRLVLVVAAREGLWARAEHTPFGHGQPYSRGQATRLLSQAMFEPQAYARALYMPPWPMCLGLSWGQGLARSWEQVGRLLLPSFSGVIMLEAKKRLYAPTGLVRAMEPVRKPVLARRSPHADPSRSVPPAV